MSFGLAARTAAAVMALGLGVSLGSAPASASVHLVDDPLGPGTFTIEKQNTSNTFDGIGSSQVRITGTNVQGGTLNPPAGGFALQVGMEKFTAWCLDTFEFLDLPALYKVTTSPFDPDPTIGPTKRADIQKLFDTGYQGLLDMLPSGEKAAGFALALWEIANETGATYDVGAGSFRATNNATVQGHATTFLAGLALDDADVERRFNVIYLDAEGTGQDLVTVAAVPLPAAGLLLIGALGGLAYAARRQRRA